MAFVPVLNQALRDEYQSLLDTVVVEDCPSLEHVVSGIQGNKSRYMAVALKTCIPWAVIGTIHQLECSGRFDLHLHNGDPLGAPTVRVPAGRPLNWASTNPKTWEASAVDALTMHDWDHNRDWTGPGICFLLECYNGLGYRMYHKDVLTPYLWSMTNHYIKGKYKEVKVNGKWVVQFDTELKSKQIGCIPILHELGLL